MADPSNYPAVPCMPYAAIRDQVRTGDLLLCSGSSLFSTLIQYATDSIWSHVGLLFRLDRRYDRILVLESVESVGVRPVPMSYYISAYNDTDVGYPGRVYIARHAGFPLDGARIITAAQNAVDSFGSHYYTKQETMGLAARVVAEKLGMLAPPRASSRHFICSEYVEPFLASVGLTIPHGPWGFIAPADYPACPDITFLWELAVTRTA